MKAINACATLQMWRLFVLAVEQGSFSKAAEVCGTDVAYISREIRKLETLMGEALLVRTKRGVKPTWPGVQRYRIAVDVVREFDELVSGYSEQSGDARNTIRIAVPASLLGLFVKWVAGFKAFADNQRLRIDLVEYAGEPLPDIGRFDIFICENELPRVRVLAEQLGYVQRGIVASVDFLKSEPLLRVPEELIGRSLIAEKSERVLMLGHEMSDEVKSSAVNSRGKYFQSIALQIEPAVKVNNAAALTESVRLGMGYAIGVPMWQVVEQIKKGELVRVLTNWHIAARPVWLMRQSGTCASDQLASICRYFRECWSRTEGLETPGVSMQPATDIH